MYQYSFTYNKYATLMQDVTNRENCEGWEEYMEFFVLSAQLLSKSKTVLKNKSINCFFKRCSHMLVHTIFTKIRIGVFPPKENGPFFFID